MELDFFLKGILLGFSIAAPVGPIGILCIRRTLQYGRFSGLFSGLGAAVADTVYGAIAAFGLTFVSDLLMAWQFWLQLVGGIFLIYLGIKTISSKSRDDTKQVTHTSLISDFVSTFFLTLTNPLTILSYLAIFAALGLTDSIEKSSNAVILIAGVFLGSILWWLILSEGLTLFRQRISEQLMVWINRAAGLLIVGFGLLALLAAFDIIHIL